MKYLTILMILLCGVYSGAQSRKDINSDCDYDFDFKFLVVQNWANEKRRDVDVFMDPKAFNNRNLRKLFQYFSSKYRSPEIMSVRVETDWYTAAAPNIDCEGNADSELPSDPERDKYHWALFLRRGENEVYRFNPKLGEKSMETVLLKGKEF